MNWEIPQTYSGADETDGQLFNLADEARMVFAARKLNVRHLPKRAVEDRDIVLDAESNVGIEVEGLVARRLPIRLPDQFSILISPYCGTTNPFRGGGGHSRFEWGEPVTDF